MNKSSEAIIVDIIRKELGLNQQAVWQQNENREIPKDGGLYIIVGMVDSQYISNTNTAVSIEIPQPDPDPPIQAMKEIQRIIVRENIMINLLSSSNDASARRWEVMAALKSIYSTQQQEANYFKIFSQPASFVNTSDAEGGSQINRFSATVACHVWYIKERTLLESGYDFYDDFTQRVDDAKTIDEPEGLIEFEITAED